MRARSRLRPLLLLLLLPSACADPPPADDELPARRGDGGIAPRGEPSADGVPASLLRERQELAASGRHLAASKPEPQEGTFATAQELVATLDLDTVEFPISGAVLTTPDVLAATVRSGWGGIAPTRGTSFAVLSTGQSGNDATSSEPGVDLGVPGLADDVVTLRFTVTVPSGYNRMSFDYNFLSAEYPDFNIIGGLFNDTFTVRVTDRAGSRLAFPAITVNDSEFQPAAETILGPVHPFLLYVDDPRGVDTTFRTGLLMDAGITDFQRADIGIVGGGPVTVELQIRDLGDGLLDSAIILDNLSFAAAEVVDPMPPEVADTPNPDHDLMNHPEKRVLHDAASLPKLINGGRPVSAVTADGVTQVLIRTSLPGPGQVKFDLVSGNLVDGELSPHDGASLAWGTSATVNPVLLDGKYYALVLYRSPSTYARPPDYSIPPPDDVPPPNDANQPERPVPLTMKFLDSGIVSPLSLQLRRRPVVIVHDLWSSCPIWKNTDLWTHSDSRIGPLGPRNFLEIKCLDYTAQKGLHTDKNRAVVQDSIKDLFDELRGRGVAVSQVDLIGHGIGGLVGRLHLDRADYKSFKNFDAGDVNRLITINTPHLGSRMACEIDIYRNFNKNDGRWINLATPAQSLKTNLENGSKIFIDHQVAPGCVPIAPEDCLPDLAIDEMRLGSETIIGLPGPAAGDPRIGGLKAVTVPTHLLVSDNGLSVLRGDAMILTDNPDGNLKNLYTSMENRHPLTIPLTAGNGVPAALLGKLESLMGNQSILFCTGACDAPEDAHDLFVKVREQLGGATADLAAPFVTVTKVLSTDALSSHTRVAARPGHSARLLQLLNSPLSSGEFTTALPAPKDVVGGDTCAVPAVPPLFAPPAPMAAMAGTSAPGAAAIAPMAGTLRIVSPANGATVTPGSQITVALAAEGGLEPEAVTVSGGGSTSIIQDPPLQTSFSIPADAIGSFSLQAVAYGAGGQIAYSQLVNLNVSITTPLTSIEVMGGDFVLQRPGATRQLTVLGTYSDGVLRNLSAAGRGTIYALSNAGSLPFATISPNGLVTGLRPGDLSITVKNGNAITSVSIKVGIGSCGDGVRDPGEECDDGNVIDGDACTSTCQATNHAPLAVCASGAVCNDAGVCQSSIGDLAGASTDPDGDFLTFEQTPPGPYPVGQHSVLVSVSDGELEAECHAALEVNDCEPPSLTCPGSFAVECSGEGGAVVTPPGAEASDNCGVAVTPPAGGRLGLGTHALTYAAADPSGNAATCSAQVTVQDTVAPAISCPAPMVAECSGGGAATVSPGDGAATEACTVAAVSGPGAGSYPLGTTAVTYSAIDLSGNRATCSTTVTVQDTVAPTISCPAPVVAECTGAGQAVVDPGDATAGDVCAAVTVNDPGSGSFPLGTTEVSYTATDAGGNQASCSTTVTVQDTTPPEGFSDGAPPLWPPDHEYRIVSLADCNISVVDECAGPLPPSVSQTQINCVSSDEPDDAPGDADGNTHNDIVVLDSQRVMLRAEQHSARNGRLYNIYFKVHDAQGNRRNGVCSVEVRAQDCEPGNESHPQCSPVDSGGKHSVCF